MLDTASGSSGRPASTAAVDLAGRGRCPGAITASGFAFMAAGWFEGHKKLSGPCIYDAGPRQFYPEVMSEMNELPASYVEYLESVEEHHAAMVLPVMRESVAEGTHGVHVRGLGSHYEQAFVDDAVPFGTVKVTTT